MSQATILVVEDDVALREALTDTLSLAGYDVEVAGNGGEALAILENEEVNMVVTDVQMKPMDGHTLLKRIKVKWPELPVMLMTAYGTIEKAVEAMRDGAVDYLVKPFEAEVLVNMVGRFVPANISDSGEFVAVDPATTQVLEMVKKVAESDATVMITGESGSGKEVLAKYIHSHSPRATQMFIAINCAAIPENMLEATLFGYEKGAFTGAYKACPGKFEQAQGGTLLLDEISEMDLGLQAKLLRVLQEREVERLGGQELIKLDVRVLATSNRDMRHEVELGRFREDLYYRLNVFPVALPPLRDRPLDVVPIAKRIIEKRSSQNGVMIPVLSEQAQSKLADYDWPGNVRELDNVMQRALILQTGETIEEKDIHFESLGGGRSEKKARNNGAQLVEEHVVDMKLGDDLKTHEQNLILEALRSGMGSRKVAASILGISQRTLRYKIARMREAGIAIPGGSTVNNT